MTEAIETIQDLIKAEKNMPGRTIHNTKSTVMISLHIPILWNKTLKRMVKQGKFTNRSDAIRHMIFSHFIMNNIEVKER